MVEDESGSMVDLEPEPLLGVHGPAWKVGGMLSASLERTCLGWQLDARQEVHPQTFEEMTELMVWLYRRVDFGMVRADGSVEIGRLRSYEDSEPVPLVVRDDHVSGREQVAGAAPRFRYGHSASSAVDHVSRVRNPQRIQYPPS